MSVLYSVLYKQYKEVCDRLMVEQEETDRLSKLVGELYAKWQIAEEQNRKLKEENLEVLERISQLEWAVGA
jgi:hypothetical protein